MKKIFLLLITLIFLSCANDSISDLTDTSLLPSVVTYVNDVKPIIDSNCISCHGNTPVNGASISLLTYSQIRSAVENNDLIGRISTTQPGYLMPKGSPKLPQNLIDTVIKWQTDGFQDN